MRAVILRVFVSSWLIPVAANAQVGSTLAAEWFLKYLGASAPVKTSNDLVRR